MSRTLVLWCPDWPVAAIQDVSMYEPVAVLAANRVIACSPAARVEGIRLGLRKREAQARCPRLVVVEHDEDRDARAFEAVVATVEALAPGVDVVRPGVCALAARGPARYFGGEERAAEHLVEQVAQLCAVEAQAGIADGMFAAGLAARTGQIVSDSDTPAFLAAFDIAAIGSGVRVAAAIQSGVRVAAAIGSGVRGAAVIQSGVRGAKAVSGCDALVDLLRRLGIRTLGDFAALPAADVLARFGFAASLAHRLASGLDERPLATRQPAIDLDVTESFEEPVDRIDAAAFAARALAQRLHERLAGHGLACTRLGIEAVTERGEELHRSWRHDGLLTTAAIADRVRWQLDGWLHHRLRRSGEREPTGGIVRLRLIPDGVIADSGLQLGLWGDTGAERDRAHRAMTRVQGMLGPEAVVTAVPSGGRDPGDQIRYVPWGDERLPARPADRPWPGTLPPPAPATVLVDPVPVDVLDADGLRVGVTARLAVTAPPARLVTGATASGLASDVISGAASGRASGVTSAAASDRASGVTDAAGVTGPAAGQTGAVEIVGWAGPWPVDERWWSPEEASRRARFQVALADDRALLLCLAGGCWSVEAIYD